MEEFRRRRKSGGGDEPLLEPGRSTLTTKEATRKVGSIALRFGLAVLVSAVPVTIKLLFDSVAIGKDAPFLLLLPAVLVCAYYWGLGPGLVSTAITALGANLFFLHPYGSVTRTHDAAVAVGVYGIEGIVASWLVVTAVRVHDEHSRRTLEQERIRMDRRLASRVASSVERSRIPMASLDALGNVAHWNRAAERLLGWADQEVTGKPLPTIQEQEWPETEQLLARVMEGESMEEVQRSWRTKDGRLRDVSISLSPVYDWHGEARYVMIVIHDLKESKVISFTRRS